MRVHSRRAVTFAAVCCWVATTVFCIAGIVSGFGFTPNMNRFFFVVLALAITTTAAAVIGHVTSPLVAGHVIGARAAMRAARDGRPRGKHAAADGESNVYNLPVQRR